MKESFKTLIKDRPVLVALGTLLVASIGTMVYFLVKLNPSDLQVSIRYTTFGTEHIYAAHWTYMLSFAGFCLAILVLHTLIIKKLYATKNRRFALFFSWCSVALVVMALVVLYKILNIAGRN